MLVGIPLYQVRAGRNVIRGVGFAESATELWGNIEIFINVVVAEFLGNVGGRHLGAPDFGRCRDSIGSDGGGRR